MNSETLYLITLTAFSNAALSKRLQGLSYGELLPSGFLKDQYIYFDQVTPRPARSLVENRKMFDEWIEYLARGGAERLWLMDKVWFDEVTGGFRDAIVVEYARHAIAWRPIDWKFNSGHWRLNPRTYGIPYNTICYQSRPVSLRKPAIALDECKQRLSLVLTASAAYATALDGFHWAEIFNEALSCLNSETPRLSPLLEGVLPPYGYSHVARQLLTSAITAAGVFGGMGSWNDWIPKKSLPPGDYSLVDDLYPCVEECWMAATNSFDGRCTDLPPSASSENLSFADRRVVKEQKQKLFLRRVVDEIRNSPVIAFATLFSVYFLARFAKSIFQHLSK